MNIDLKVRSSMKRVQYRQVYVYRSMYINVCKPLLSPLG